MDTEGGSTKGHAPSSARQGRKPVRKRSSSSQSFSLYLSFGLPTTIVLCLFLSCYLIFLCLFTPLLLWTSSSKTTTTISVPMEAGPFFPHPGLKMSAVHDAQQGAQHLAENVALAVQRQIANFRNSKGVTDQSLLQKAIVDMEKLRMRRREQPPPPKPLTQSIFGASNKNDSKKKPSGVVVLGMHRSGTSMLSGLMVSGMGYQTGGPLIGSAYDNEKGFFELVPAVLQNDEFLNSQRIWWSSGAYEYDWKKALDDYRAGKIDFKEGERALQVLNDPSKIPFLQKDPRMCITLKTWLPLLNSEPAILFTYRHPLEVAKSLQHRENDFSLEHGLRLWIVYNMRAIQNSQDLCRVTTSNEAILANPRQEVLRVSVELTQKCQVPPPPETLSQEDVDKFVDGNMQHLSAQKAAENAHRKILAQYNDGKCNVYEYDGDYNATVNQPAAFQEFKMYSKAMKIYCDFQSGIAYLPNYEWPSLID